MHKEVCVCDHCGKVLESEYSRYTLRLEAYTTQSRVEWHYCPDCWKTVKNQLTNAESCEISELRKNYARMQKDIKWYERFTASMIDTFAKCLNSEASFESNQSNDPFSDCGCYAKNTDYTSYTTSTSGEKTIQAEPMGDGPFTIGCCCKNTNKDSQTT